jgi:Dyp-type peroxidase family
MKKQKKRGKLLEDATPHKDILPKGILIPSTGGDFGPELADAEPEPVFNAKDRDNIQGNIVPGFNKDHQHFLFFRLGAIDPAKTFLRKLAPLVSSMDDVLAFVRMHRSLRLRLGKREPGLKATWVNVALSHAAIEQLAGKESAASFGEQSFRQGLAERSTYLGDPADPALAGHRSRWLVGGPDNEADVIVIVASDDSNDLVDMVREVTDRAADGDLTLLFEQRGDTFAGDFRGHEHFGFKDGISQPGVRGKTSSARGDFITPRFLDRGDPHARLFGKPGQTLIWPGQFLLGERRQNPEDLFSSAAPARNFPKWARQGSYLVVRRLAQDVSAFWTFVGNLAERVGLPGDRVASMLVGRWPSGAPIMRTPTADDEVLAGDEFANNHFIFDDDTRPSVLRPIPGYGGDDHPQADADLLGSVCPHFAHIRKANPRDSATDLGKTADTLIRMILRRGIPFGEPLLDLENPPPKLVQQERGLMFLCYAATIEDQFEFLTRRWANSPVQPNLGGHDPVVGQEGRGTRQRFIDFPTASGAERVLLDDEWVTVTGGGYFFAPPIRALTEVLGA